MMLVALHGDEMLEAITLRSLQTGEDTSVETRWLFICIGGAPALNGLRNWTLFGIPAPISSLAPSF